MGRHAVSALTIFVIFQLVSANTETSCEDGWIPYKDKKCLKIISDEFLQYSNAKTYCKNVDTTERTSSSLLSIKDEREQIDLFNLIFTIRNIENDLWLGLEQTQNGSYVWADGGPLEFANWINETKPKFDNPCVELSTQGKWFVVSCTRRNMFVCEKQQSWSISKIQKSFLEFEKQQLENQKSFLEFQKQQLENQKTFLEFKKQQLENPVPIGFIYVQLSGQPDPQTLWPAVKWEDITIKYAGLFFRAEGAGSAKFNDGEQTENSPRLISVDSRMYTASREIHHVNVVYGGQSERLLTGDDKPGVVPSWNIRFKHSGGEVRPRNQAIRIWRRMR